MRMLLFSLCDWVMPPIYHPTVAHPHLLLTMHSVERQKRLHQAMRATMAATPRTKTSLHYLIPRVTRPATDCPPVAKLLKHSIAETLVEMSTKTIGMSPSKARATRLCPMSINMIPDQV